MKTVFQSNMPYLQVSKMSVMNVKPVYCKEQTFHSDSGTSVRVKRQAVGTQVTSSKKYSFLDVWVFAEGKRHNRLTLTDPEEIKAFREFIKSRDYIHEIEEASGE